MNVMLTRAADESSATVNLFLSEGFAPYCLPMIETVPLAAKMEKSAYDIGIFTSIVAVKYFARYKDEIKLKRYIATGPVTKERIKLLLGVKNSDTPSEYSAEGIREMLTGEELSGQCILSPGALERSTDLSLFFKEKGAYYETAALYRTCPIIRKDTEVADFIKKHNIEVVCFFSASAVRAFFETTNLPKGIKAAAIGKASAAAIRDCGIAPLVAEEATTEGLVKLLKGRR